MSSPTAMLRLARPFGQLWLVASLSVLLVVSRRPDAVLHAQFWAEDGRYWFLQAHQSGWWRPLLMQQNGYLQTVSRLIGALAQAVPLAYAPLLFNACAIIFQVLPVLLLYTSRGRALLPRPWLRLIISLLYLGHPFSAEVHANVTNIHWHLVLAATMILVFPRSSLRGMRLFDGVLLALASLSGPFSVFLAPIAVTLAWRRGGRRALGLATLILVCAMVQGSLLILHHGQGDRFTSGLGASPGLLLRLFASKVVLASLFGMKPAVMAVSVAWKAWWPSLLISLSGALILVLGFLRGSALARAVIWLGTMVFVSSLILPQISADQPQWRVYLMPAAGARYAFLPVLAFYAALLVLAQGKDRLLHRVAATALAMTLFYGLPANWRMGSWPDLSFPYYAQVYQQARPGQEVDIPVYPGPFWTLKLVKPIHATEQ